MHLFKTAQIAHLKADEVSIKVSSKYANFTDIFLSKLAINLNQYTENNNHAIKLVDN